MKRSVRLIAFFSLITFALVLLFSGCMLVVSSDDDFLNKNNQTQIIGDNNTTIIKSDKVSSTIDETVSNKTKETSQEVVKFLLALLMLISGVIGTITARGKSAKLKSLIDAVISILKIR